VTQWFFGGTLATLFSTAGLTVPAVLAMRWLLGRRPAAPLERGWVEEQVVLASAVLGGLGAVAWSDAIAFTVGSTYDRGELASVLLGFLAPIPLAAIPWFAGEALSGASQRPWSSLVASALVSTFASWTTFALCWTNAHRFTPEMALIQVAASLATGYGAARTYLHTRGQPRAALPTAALQLEDFS
jgi:hypothetical protein